MQRCDSKVVNY